MHTVARQDVTHRLDWMSRIKATLGIKEVNIKRGTGCDSQVGPNVKD